MNVKDVVDLTESIFLYLPKVSESTASFFSFFLFIFLLSSTFFFLSCLYLRAYGRRLRKRVERVER